MEMAKNVNNLFPQYIYDYQDLSPGTNREQVSIKNDATATAMPHSLK